MSSAAMKRAIPPAPMGMSFGATAAPATLATVAAGALVSNAASSGAKHRHYVIFIVVPIRAVRIVGFFLPRACPPVTRSRYNTQFLTRKSEESVSNRMINEFTDGTACF